MGIAYLKDRGIVRIDGADAKGFLQNLLTCDVDAISPGHAGFGALLTPQGKILFDFIIHRTEDDHFLFDIASQRMDAFIKQLGFYRLRAKIGIENISGNYAVIAGWDGAAFPENSAAVSPDPRLPALGWRAVVRKEDCNGGDAEDIYHAHRIGLSVPESGKDFAFEDAFPHEADMDQLHGVSFTKGCYVGQEVVSRMQHRGTARTRIMGADFTGPERPSPGTGITAGDRMIGRTGSVSENKLVAMVRIDKALDAKAAGEAIMAGQIALLLRKPEWATFDFPDER